MRVEKNMRMRIISYGFDSHSNIIAIHIPTFVNLEFLNYTCCKVTQMRRTIHIVFSLIWVHLWGNHHLS